MQRSGPPGRSVPEDAAAWVTLRNVFFLFVLETFTLAVAGVIKVAIILLLAFC